MTNIIETKFGTLVNTSKIAAGSASSIKKNGAFYNFSIRISNDDIREYSFTDLGRAQYMRRIMIGHLEEKIKKESKTVQFKNLNLCITSFFKLMIKKIKFWSI